MVDLFGPPRFLTPARCRSLEESLGITTTLGLLQHYPRRYIVNNELSDLADLVEGDYVTVMAEVRSVTTRPSSRDPATQIATIVITDGTARVTVVFFRKGKARFVRLPEQGERALFAGRVSSYRGELQLAHPQFIPLRGDDADAEKVAQFTAPIRPIYPATSALPSEKLRLAIAGALDVLGPLPDPLPDAARGDLMDWDDAIRTVHLPPTLEALRAAQERLRFDEAFAPQVALARQRASLRSAAARPRPRRSEGLLEAFDIRLPYELTASQRTVGDVLAEDLSREHPMHRLLQGDVGSGKTVVALRAMLEVVDAGGQAALLAPTDVLAHQHWRTITGLLGPLAERGRLRFDDQTGPEGTSVVLLTGSLPAAARRAALLDIASGAAGIVVGTHALLQEHVTFADLAFVVVDEQHRFGVEQRAALAAKAVDGTRPHVLVMTATPIPRTVAMTMFGDLDPTVLDELPRGRAPVATHVVPTGNARYLARVWERIREECAAGRRAFVVCPRIDSAAGAAEEGGGAAVLDLVDALRSGDLRGLRIGTLHGRMSSEEKEAAMAAFAADGPEALDVLICTTVVEVGIDVPRASVMVVMDADRFGVSQLHQLRGRIGRGSDPGVCLLVTGAEEGSVSRERLDAVAATSDGFALARLDLEQRREGDVLGSAQSGRSGFAFLDLLRDESVIASAHVAAEELVAADPQLREHRTLAAFLAELDSRTDYLMKD